MKVFTRAVKQEKHTQKIGKNEVKQFLFIGYMIVYVGNPNKYNYLLVCEFSKILGYKVYIQRAIIFLYICNKSSKFNF